jgi:DNA helicase-2/ATP-dependent DNA helicase PcrA
MVERVVAALPHVRSFQYLAAITFTNAAAASIRERVHRVTRPGPNVFIGTIHSFANRFIVAPFARIFHILPDDLVFGAIDVHGLLKDKENRDRPLTPQARSKIRTNIVASLLKKGVVPYDEIIKVAVEVMEKQCVCERVCRRLHSLFIDELQDTDTRHLKLFEHIRKAGHTRIYAVGDPEQFVYSFTYGQRGLKHPNFEKIPFFQFRARSAQEAETINRRSCDEIVRFGNAFHSQLQQTSDVGSRGEPRVLFIPETDLAAIVRRFRDRSEQLVNQRGRLRRLYLGFENAAFDEVRDLFGIRRLSNDSRRHGTLLQDALELLALFRGTSQRRTCEALSLGELEWRKWGLLLIREVRDGQVTTMEDMRERWASRLQISEFEQRSVGVQDALNHLLAGVSAERSANWQEWSSSIHKSKGLEATSVLVVAASVNELCKWCVTDPSQRNGDKQDKCRLGFVAFTRAMELLCISCRKPLTEKDKSGLQQLGITMLQDAR